MSPAGHKRGRGAQINPHNRFLRHRYEHSEDLPPPEEEDNPSPTATRFIEVHPKSILSENDSPDLGFRYGLNPYNGCEHGCVYCYARNSHEYWGFSAGMDFEQVILYKPRAAQLLSETFRRPGYVPDHIMFSGNTDCYQPAERSFGITRQLLEVLLKHRHPVGIITKNALVLRDLDLLRELNAMNLLRITLSITTLREEVRRKMEPRTSSVQQRLKALETLVAEGIPVHVNMAPVIMGLNSEEVFDLVREVGLRGACGVSYILVRLNGQVAGIFEEWVRRTYPEKADRILNQVRETHGGTLNESRWGTRMSGEGVHAGQVSKMFEVARKKYITAPAPGPADFTQFIRNPDQLSLF